MSPLVCFWRSNLERSGLLMAKTKLMKILVIATQDTTILPILTENSVTAEWTRFYADSLEGAHNLIIIDDPSSNGSSLCLAIRRQNRDVPILIVSSLDEASDKVQGLDAGADDYLSRPFHTDELLARIKALARRTRLSPSTHRVADVEIDAYKRTVVRGGKRIALTATEFALLELLMRHKNHVLPRAYISEAVWGIGFDRRTNLVDVYINYLRHKIDINTDWRLIHTVVGKGYMLKEAGN